MSLRGHDMNVRGAGAQVLQRLSDPVGAAERDGIGSGCMPFLQAGGEGDVFEACADAGENRAGGGEGDIDGAERGEPGVFRGMALGAGGPGGFALIQPASDPGGVASFGAATMEQSGGTEELREDAAESVEFVDAAGFESPGG